MPPPRSVAQAFAWLDRGNFGERMRAVDLLSGQGARTRRRLERHLLDNLDQIDHNDDDHSDVFAAQRYLIRVGASGTGFFRSWMGDKSWVYHDLEPQLVSGLTAQKVVAAVLRGDRSLDAAAPLLDLLLERETMARGMALVVSAAVRARTGAERKRWLDYLPDAARTLRYARTYPAYPKSHINPPKLPDPRAQRADWQTLVADRTPFAPLAEFSCRFGNDPYETLGDYALFAFDTACADRDDWFSIEHFGRQGMTHLRERFAAAMAGRPGPAAPKWSENPTPQQEDQLKKLRALPAADLPAVLDGMSDADLEWYACWVSSQYNSREADAKLTVLARRVAEVDVVAAGQEAREDLASWQGTDLTVERLRRLQAYALAATRQGHATTVLVVREARCHGVRIVYHERATGEAIARCRLYATGPEPSGKLEAEMDGPGSYDSTAWSLESPSPDAAKSPQWWEASPEQQEQFWHKAELCLVGGDVSPFLCATLTMEGYPARQPEEGQNKEER